MEDKQAVEEGVIFADKITVPGIVMDSEGHTWTIPEEDPTGDEIRLYRSPFDIKKDERFHYQFDHYKDISQLMADGFVPCTRKELGLPEFKISGQPSNEYGVDSGVYMVGDLVAVKTPKILADRKYAAQSRVCQAAVNSTEPKKKGESSDEVNFASPEIQARQDALAKQRSNSNGRKYEMSHKKVRVTPKNPENV